MNYVNQFLTFHFIIIFLFIHFITAINREKNILILLDSLTDKFDYSVYFSDLAERYKIDYITHFDRKINLKKYDSLIIMSNNILYKRAPTLIKEFVKSGRGLLVMTDSNIKSEIRDLANNYDIVLNPKSTYITDNINRGNDNKEVIVKSYNRNNVVNRDLAGKKIIYSGIGLKDMNDDEYILKGMKETLSCDGKEMMCTKNIKLIDYFIGENDERVIVSGSKVMCSDSYYHRDIGEDQNGNRLLCTSLFKWTLKETGELHTDKITYTLYKDGKLNTDQTIKNITSFKINDKIKYSLNIYQQIGSKLVPFDSDDLFIELIIMGKSKLRKKLLTDHKGKYWAIIELLLNKGVYDIKVNYQKNGYWNLNLVHEIIVYPLSNEDWGRTTMGVYPYYLVEIMMLLSSMVFCWAFICIKDNKSNKIE